MVKKMIETKPRDVYVCEICNSTYTYFKDAYFCEQRCKSIICLHENIGHEFYAEIDKDGFQTYVSLSICKDCNKRIQQHSLHELNMTEDMCKTLFDLFSKEMEG